MLISELARLTGVSARALRHYEDRGLLVPARDDNGYRDYSESDVIRVAQIRMMISAGLGTSTIQRYLDCVRTGEHGTHLEMCPGLRAELDAMARRLDAQQAELAERRRRLCALAAATSPKPAAGNAAT
ncbi:MerR family transcriptional regulator [Actinoallomurus rhizosphaericola]|uniref:MerR family transcriptional regulator n=1 Tax=Actinoallomurus rhizosphaericola TaxID=2952536 RepID=UPI0020936245|nr:MerR family transcriptional regulator [Actinoallomurus rhizosphaericola]MCO5996080.1 MerR family transcriptional regulator [Actinoallomurus rhizosphaericola]